MLVRKVGLGRVGRASEEGRLGEGKESEEGGFGEFRDC